MRRSPLITAIAAIFLLIPAAGPADEPDPVTAAHEENIKALEKLGARIGTVWAPAAPFEQVIWVDFMDAKVRDDDLALIQGMTALLDLRLDGSSLTEAGLARLEGLTKLESLTIRKMPKVGKGLGHLKGMKSLRYLNLSGSKVTGQELSSLSVSAEGY